MSKDAVLDLYSFCLTFFNSVDALNKNGMMSEYAILEIGEELIKRLNLFMVDLLMEIAKTDYKIVLSRTFVASGMEFEAERNNIPFPASVFQNCVVLDLLSQSYNNFKGGFNISDGIKEMTEILDWALDSDFNACTESTEELKSLKTVLFDIWMLVNPVCRAAELQRECY